MSKYLKNATHPFHKTIFDDYRRKKIKIRSFYHVSKYIIKALSHKYNIKNNRSIVIKYIYSNLLGFVSRNNVIYYNNRRCDKQHAIRKTITHEYIHYLRIHRFRKMKYRTQLQIAFEEFLAEYCSDYFENNFYNLDHYMEMVIRDHNLKVDKIKLRKMISRKWNSIFEILDFNK